MEPIDAELDTQEYLDAVNHAECPGCRGAFSSVDHTFPMRDWHDKPHRLVFDLCREIERLRSLRSAHQEKAEELLREAEEMLRFDPENQEPKAGRYTTAQLIIARAGVHAQLALIDDPR